MEQRNRNMGILDRIHGREDIIRLLHAGEISEGAAKILIKLAERDDTLLCSIGEGAARKQASGEDRMAAAEFDFILDVAARLRAGKIDQVEAGALMSLTEERIQVKAPAEGRKLEGRALQRLLDKLHREDRKLLDEARLPDGVAGGSRFMARARRRISDRSLERIHRSALREVLGREPK